MKRLPCIFLTLIILLLGSTGTVVGQDIPEDVYSSLKYRYIGPVGNRVIAVIGEPGNPNVYYYGAASGGIFKTTNGGVSFEPVFDKQQVSSASALAMAPSNKNVIWAGTGETFIRSNISIGNGVYKSTDGGKNWEHMGLVNTGRIARVIIHPTNPDIVWVAALGHCYGPQEDRGVFKTIDGGKTWEKTLFVDENTGCSDIAIDPNNPRILLAGMWQIEMKTWVRNSGGPGSGLYMSRDGGTTWKKLESGLPKSPLGKIGVTIGQSDSDKMYALIETKDKDFLGVLWRSDNGGSSWKLISYDQEYNQRPHYYQRCVVAPQNADIVYFLAHGVWKTVDGGKTATSIPGVGGDDHDMWIDPLMPDRMIVGNDGGVSISTDGGKSWFRPALPIAQMYHVEVDNQIPYNVYGNRQDGPSTMGPSNSRTGRSTIPIGMWHPVGGFECGFSIVDYEDNNIVWGGGYDGLLTRYDNSTGHSRNVNVWPDEPMGWGPAELKYRWNWTFPIAISPHDHNRIYVGSQYVHMTTDGGHSWKEISPDLTTNDKSKQVTSGGLTIDNIQVDAGCTIFSIAESKLEDGLIWAGSNDGLLHVTRDLGQTWDNVTENIPDMPYWGIVSNIEPSRYEAGKCYISVDVHRMNNRDPYIYVTENYGKKWKRITDGIPHSVFSFVHCVREDPVRPGMLYAGTENSVFVSFNDGKNWQKLQNNLPHAPVHWLVVQEHFSDLVIGTYGRGFWILDDITPLRELGEEMLETGVHFFTPRAAYRFAEIETPNSVRTDADGFNPEYGAALNYYFAEAPEDTVYFTVHDQSGNKIREFKANGKKGINRVHWDLRHERALEPKLRTHPLGHPGVYAGPERLRYGKNGWRPLVTWGYPGFIGPRAVPGEYTVKLHVGDREFAQTVEVRKDPNTKGTVAEIGKQVALALEVRDNITEVAKMVNALEWTRKQIDDLVPLLQDDEDLMDLVPAAEELDKHCIDIESKLFQLTLTGTFADDLRGPTMLYSKLMSLASNIMTDDHEPTTQMYAVHDLHSETLTGHQRQFNEVMNTHLVDFNRQLQDRGLLNIIVPKGK